jgi:hypothetical protein
MPPLSKWRVQEVRCHGGVQDGRVMTIWARLGVSRSMPRSRAERGGERGEYQSEGENLEAGVEILAPT